MMPLPIVVVQHPMRLHRSIIHRTTRLDETALPRLNKAALQSEVVVLRRMVATVFRNLVLHRALDVAVAVAPRHVGD